MAFNNQLVEAQFRAAQIWEATKTDPSKQPRINALAAIMAESTARIDNTYSDPEKKRTNRVFWMNRRCAETPETGRPGCDLDYNELDAGSKTYSLTRVIHDGFKVPFRDFETSVFQRTEVEAEGIVDTEKKLFEAFNARVHAVLNDPTNLTSIALGGLTVDPTSKSVIVPPEMWTAKVLGIATRYSKQIGMNDPYIISGAALYDILFDVKKDDGMEMNIGKAARVRDHRIYLDFTLDSTLSAEKFFLIDKGVLAVLNRADWKNTTPISIDGASRLAWSKTSTVMNTPIGVGIDGKPVSFKIDRHTQRTCVSGVDFVDQHGFALNADVVKMPDADCTDDATINGGTYDGKYTGIVAFECGTPIAGSGS